MFAGRPYDCLPSVNRLFFAILPGSHAAALSNYPRESERISPDRLDCSMPVSLGV